MPIVQLDSLLVFAGGFLHPYESSVVAHARKSYFL